METNELSPTAAKPDKCEYCATPIPAGTWNCDDDTCKGLAWRPSK